MDERSEQDDPPADGRTDSPPADGVQTGPQLTHQRPPRSWGAAAGLVSMAAGLGAGQLAAGLARDLEPPVVSVGNRVVDAAPAWLKTFAIDTFGTGDKTALIVGTVLVLAAVSVLAGMVALRRSLAGGLAVVAGFGLVGMTAAGLDDNSGGWGWLPSAVAMVAAGASLTLLTRLATRPAAAPGGGPAADRRRFLTGIGALAVSTAVALAAGRALRSRFAAEVERAGIRLRRPVEPLAAPPADPAATIAGLSPLLVPNADFYRIDTSLLLPAVTVETWDLTIDGMVEQPLRFTYDQLWDRELHEYDLTLSCVSNEIGGDLVGNARWVGVRLDELLIEAGIEPDADQIMTHSVDGFTAGFPVEAALDGRDAIVALTMNGEVLPAVHGYPARLIVPGLYGYVSATKWLSRLELTRFDRAQGYWIPRGWAVQAPIKTQSRIDTPRSGSSVPAGATAIAGVAWAPIRGVTKVEVQVGDGPWQQAELGPSLGEAAWRQWWFSWQAEPGTYLVRCRATDGTGTTQPREVTPVAPDGATGWHTIKVKVER